MATDDAQRWSTLRARFKKEGEDALTASEIRELKRLNKTFLASRRDRRRRAQVLSYGGGLDSFCMLVDSIKRGDAPDAIVFADVGDPAQLDPGEWPETYEHILVHAAPLARKNGIPFYWLTGGEPPSNWKRRFAKAGVTWEEYPIRGTGADVSPSLIQWFEYEGKEGGRVQLPVKGPLRSCTTVAKVERFEKWLNDHYPDEVVDVWIGFETGEEYRAVRGDPFSQPHKPRSGETHRVNFFPLIQGALPRTRGECRRMILKEGLVPPTKSACVFCPYGTQEPWREFARRDPEGFARVEALEARKLAKPTARGYRLSIQGWGRHSLSPSMHRVLLKLVKAQRSKRPVDAAGLKGADWQSFRSMLKRQWVAENGKLTVYGKDILQEAGATPRRGDTKAERKELGEIVWRAARRRGLPIRGVHYDYTPLGEYAACRLSTDEDALKTAQGEWLVRKNNPEVARLSSRLTRI